MREEWRPNDYALAKGLHVLHAYYYGARRFIASTRGTETFYNPKCPNLTRTSMDAYFLYCAERQEPSKYGRIMSEEGRPMTIGPMLP